MLTDGAILSLRLMTPIPVIHSTLSPVHLEPWIAEAYGLNDVSCRLFRTNMNHTYMVTAQGERYVLRIYNHQHRTKEQVSEEVALLNMLRSAGVGVSYPIHGSDGAFIYELLAPEGNRYVVLFSFAAGNKMRFFSPELCAQIGAAVGRMHVVTQGKVIDRTQYRPDEMAAWAYKQLTAYFSEQLEELQFIKACEQKLAEAFRLSPALRRGVVHLDLWYDNIAITDEGKITFFDFDNCGNGPLVLDIGYFCKQLYHIEADKQVYEQKKRAFIDGYRSVCPIADEELTLMPYAGAAIWIYYAGLQAQRFDYFANIFLTENYLKMFIGRVKDWLSYNGIMSGS